MVKIVRASYEKSIQFEADDWRDDELQIHDSLEILFILTGDVDIEINSRKIQLKEEELYIINRYEVHRIVCGEGAHTLSLFLGSDVLGRKFLPVYGEVEERGSGLRILELKQNLAHMFRLFYKDSERNREEIFSCAYHMLGVLQNDFSADMEQKLLPRKSFEHIDEMLRYINEHYADKLVLADLASKFYISSGHISRLFKNYVKMSFHAYVREVRLHHAYLELRTGDHSITQIAYDCGFGTANLMIDAFQKKYGITPGKLRKQMQQAGGVRTEKTPDMFLHLMKFIKEDQNSDKIHWQTEVVNIQADAQGEGCPVRNQFLRLLNIGWARDLLMEPIRSQICLCQKKIGYQYLRCHGIFDDDMMVYHEDMEHHVSYNFFYVDQIYDFLLSVGLKPYVELSYIPTQMAKAKGEWFYKNVCVCVPTSIKAWCDLVHAFVMHCVKRYGEEEVCTWRFTIMSALHVYYKNLSDREYLEFYRETRDTLKGICPRLQIGNSGTELSLCLRDNAVTLKKYFDYYVSYNCVPDFFCFQMFYNIYDYDYKKALSLVRIHKTEPLPITDNPDYLADSLGQLRELMKMYGWEDAPLVLECWNSTIWQRDLCNDTCYKSSFIFKNILDNLHENITVGYWSMSDMMEELFAEEKIFHGGYGMFTRNGIPKSAFTAFCLLKKLGNIILISGDGYSITRREDGSVCAAFYNYSHYDSLSRQNFRTEGNNTQRYKVFYNEKKREYQLQLQMEPGEYEIESYGISRKCNCGSSYDSWVLMGAPEDLTPEQEAFLKKSSFPYYIYSKETVQKSLRLRAVLEPHEVRILVIHKSGSPINQF